MLKHFELLNRSVEIAEYGKFLLVNLTDRYKSSVRQDRKLAERCEQHGLIEREGDYPQQMIANTMNDFNLKMDPDDDGASITLFKLTSKGLRYLQDADRFVQLFRMDERELFWRNTKSNYKEVWIAVLAGLLVAGISFAGGMYLSQYLNRDEQQNEAVIEQIQLPDQEISETAMPDCRDNLDQLLDDSGLVAISDGNGQPVVHMRPDGYFVLEQDSCIVAMG